MSDEISSNSRLMYLRDQAVAAARQHGEDQHDPNQHDPNQREPDEFGPDQSGRRRRDPDRGGRDGPVSGALARFAVRWLPESVLRSGSPSRRRLAALAALLGVVGAVVFAVALIRSGPVVESPPPLPLARERARAALTDDGPSAEGKEDEPVVVSVVGKVHDPGLVTVPAGSRVAVALEAAGGAHDGVDLATVNLARKLTDGEQIYVGVPVPAAGAAAGPAGAPGTSAKVNLNTATAEQLDELPGVGEVTAGRILDWRSEHGAFTAVEQLCEVSGIGDTRLSRLRDHVSVG